MAQFGASIQTAQVTTGNFQTTVDAYVSGYAGYPNNPGERAIPGAAYYDSTGSNSNPWGAPGKYRYVRYNSTSNPALTNLTAPAPCYWTDTTFTTVTPVYSEGVAGINLVAGLIMPNTTALTTLTATMLNGNYIWICVGGYVGGVIGVTGAAAGDSIIGSTTTFAPAHVSAGTASTNRVIGYATSAVGTPSTGLINILVTLES
jgi:hypothetical protein